MRRWELPFYSEHSFDTEKLDSVLADIGEGRSWSDLKANLHKARDWAIHQTVNAAEDLGANAVIGVKIDYKTVSNQYGGERAMILIATGTAVRL